MENEQPRKRGRPYGPTSQSIKRMQAIKRWRSRGMPWWKIGEQLGMTKQGAQQIQTRLEESHGNNIDPEPQ